MNTILLTDNFLFRNSTNLYEIFTINQTIFFAIFLYIIKKKLLHKLMLNMFYVSRREDEREKKFFNIT